MSLSKLSIKKLRQIGKDIVNEYDLYDQGEPPSSVFINCMTPSCFAGWAIWNENPTPKAYRKAMLAPGNSTEKMAHALGITFVQASELFSEWPGEGSSPAWKKPCTLAGAKDGVKHIDLFIKNGGTFDVKPGV